MVCTTPNSEHLHNVERATLIIVPFIISITVGIRITRRHKDYH